MGKRWKLRPAGSNWGEFGDDDQLGSLNYITPGAVLKAARGIEHGRNFCLSLPLDYPGGSVLAPHRTPPVLTPTERKGKSYFNYSFSNDGAGYCDGVLLAHAYRAARSPLRSLAVEAQPF